MPNLDVLACLVYHVSFSSNCIFSALFQLKEGDKKSRAWMSLFQTKRIRGFFPMTRYSPLGDYKELTSKLEVELEVLTEEEAAEKPSGKARDDPNSHPRLEAPERPKTSFHFWMNPWRFVAGFVTCCQIISTRTLFGLF